MSLQIFSKQTKIDFVGMRHYAYGLSALLILVGLITIFMNGGLRYGVDFAGGAAVQLQFEKPVADEDIKKSLAEMELPGLAIQQYGEDGRDYLVRFSTPNLTSEGIRSNILSSLEKSFAGNPASIQRLEMVGPKVGADLRNAALEAMYFAILLITVYISGRFEQRWMIAALMAAVLGSAMYVMGFLGMDMVYRVIGALALTLLISWKLKLNYALGAIVGLLHDVLITLGLLAMMGKEIDLNIIAALMTLVGYSLNDTIIVYDRIRENLQNQPEDNPAPLADQPEREPDPWPYDHDLGDDPDRRPEPDDPWRRCDPRLCADHEPRRVYRYVLFRLRLQPDPAPARRYPPVYGGPQEGGIRAPRRTRGRVSFSRGAEEGVLKKCSLPGPPPATLWPY